MNMMTLETPKLYGDHHVVEVRKLLLDIPGVTDVYASSSFHLIEVTYDPDQIQEQAIVERLEAAGYLGELEFSVEVPASPSEGNGKPYFRRTNIYEALPKAITFSQQVTQTRAAVWPCPGIGALRKKE